MIFNSIQYLVFFPVVVLLYFNTPPKYKNLLLLAASYYFYMCWNPIYAILIIFSTVSTYLAGYLIIKSNNIIQKKTALAVNIVINLLILFSFKYYNFFVESLIRIFEVGGIEFIIPKSTFLLPVGISFYTFQALGYSIDVYRKTVIHEHNFINYALFVSFFPQLVAGPIERSNHLLPQFQSHYSFDYDRVVSGLRLILWGFFEKIVLADNLSVIVDNVYNHPEEFTGLPIMIATIAFAFQIFCDFAGYSHIAIGSARVLGYRLMTNFDKPYHAKNVREFWRRWHISLSTWFKDYVYIPLGGNRVSYARINFNIMITFLVSGLWHGANWTYVIWGGLHGMYLVMSNMTSDVRARIADAIGLGKVPRLHCALQITSTFILVTFAWIFFRAASVNDAIYIITRMFDITIPKNLGDLFTMLRLFGCGGLMILTVFPAWCIMEMVHILQTKYSINQLIMNRSWLTRKLIYIFFILYIVFLGNYGNQAFIYFQF